VSDSQPLFELLQSIKPQVIYTLASPRILKNATSIFPNQMVDGF